MAAGCLGPFFGKFHNELEDEEDVDDRPGTAREERAAEANKAAKRGFFSRMSARAIGTGEGSRGGDFALKRHIKEFRPHSRQAEGTQAGSKSRHKKEQKVERLRVVNKSQRELPDSMMSNVFRQNKLHTIEIIRCRREKWPPFLNELERLAVINMSHNELTTFSRDLARCTQLEQIILEFNKIPDLPHAMFGKDVFANLTVLNLAHNQLSVLPEDFLKGVDKIELLNLSSNYIRKLPAIPHCVKLRELDLSHNNLKQLPDSVPFYFEKLTKLFISFNELTSLPEDIGNCDNLEKIRMMNNRIRELPPSILMLWPMPFEEPKDSRKAIFDEYRERLREAVKAGRLLKPTWWPRQEKGEPPPSEKRLLEAQPSVRPGKLEEFLVEKNPLQNPTITSFQMEEGDAKGEKRDPNNRRRPFDRAFHLFQQELDKDDYKKHRAAECWEKVREAYSPSSRAAGTPITSRSSRSLREPGMDDTPLEDENGRLMSSPQIGVPQLAREDPYWFGHCTTKEQVVAIRNAESSILMLKRSSYIEIAFKSSGADNEEERRTKIDEGLEEFKQHFVGSVPVQPTDLYFNLLVYTMKPEKDSIVELFEQSIAKDMNYMTVDEWKDLILSMSMTFKDNIVNEMWSVMDFRGSGRVSLSEFIGAWHVHDVETSDPWVAQLAGTLGLDYYGMSAEEVQERLRGWDGRLDLEESSAQYGLGRLDAHSRRRRRGGHSETEEDRHGGSSKALEKNRKALVNRISLNEAEYHEVGGGDSEDDSDASLQSFELSACSEEEDAFDAQMMRHRQQETEKATDSDLHNRRVIVNSDAAMRRLMELSPEEFTRQRELQEMSEVLELQQQAKSTSKDVKGFISSGVDPGVGVGTDTFAVRQSLREVYRNMPMADFVGLVNFLLRGLQTIKHSMATRDSYWHKDNPAFAHSMGTGSTNMYTRRLLIQMGFHLLNGTYWVWPEIHLDLAAGATWGANEVSSDCPGRESRRLDDMIELLKNCQKDIRQRGNRFNGHFKMTRA